MTTQTTKIKITNKRTYYKNDKRYILFKFFKENYAINEQDKGILNFNTLKDANEYLRQQEVLK